MSKIHTIAAFVCLLSFVGCRYPGYYEKQVQIPDFNWSSSFKPNFEFDVKDSSSTYNLFVVLRHFDNYHYNNMWIDFTSIAPGDTAITQKINLKLGDNNQWMGNAMDDIIEHRIRITKDPIKMKTGHYMFILKNAMREDPLQQVMNVGVRIEKTGE